MMYELINQFKKKSCVPTKHLCILIPVTYDTLFEPIFCSDAENRK